MRAWGWLIAGWKIAGGTVAELWRPHGPALNQIATKLGGEVAYGWASGKHRGLAVRLRFASRGSGSDSVQWTEIEAELPRAYPLAIHARYDTGKEFVVEAAPGPVADELLDGKTRCELMMHHHVELDTVAHSERRALRLAIRGWVEAVPTALAAIDSVARISGRVRSTYAAVVSAMPAQAEGAPHREQPNDQAARDTMTTWAAEVTALETRRGHRRIIHTVVVVAVLLLIALFLMVSAGTHD